MTGIKAQLTFLIVFFSFNFCAQMPTGIIGTGLFMGDKITFQKPVKLASGDVQLLIGVKCINIKYDYEYMAVCNFTSEADYLSSIEQHHNDKRGSSIIEKWKSLPKTVFEPRFEELFIKYSNGIQIYHDTAQRATLIVKVLREDPHYHNETGRKEEVMPYAVFECTFLDIEGYFIARFNLTTYGYFHSKFNGLISYDDGSKLEDSYANGGKMLAQEITKRLNKLKNK